MQSTLPIGSPLTVGTQRHICVVSETYPPEVNGVAMTLERLVKGLHAQGYAVSIVRPRPRLADDHDCTGELGDATTLVHGVPLPGTLGLQFGLPAGGVLRRCWTQHRPDVVYVATEGPLGWSAARAARRLGIPVWSGFHTNFHSYSQHYYYAGWLQPFALRYLRSFHNHTAGTLVPSHDQLDRLDALGFTNVRLLDRGVDSQLFTPQRRSAELRRHWGLTETDLAVLYVGRLAPEKNLSLAVKAYRAMQNSGTRVKFVIVGDGPLRATLQREHPDLTFCGLRTGEQLAKHYASADVFLFPSETETFGNVTLEAMASGLAVVAYNYAAAKMHITPGETGVLAPYRDEKAFVDAAVRLVGDPQSVQQVRRHAREHVAAYDWQRIVERFTALLTSGVDRHDRASVNHTVGALSPLEL